MFCFSYFVVRTQTFHVAKECCFRIASCEVKSPLLRRKYRNLSVGAKSLTTNSMELSITLEVTSCEATQERSSILWNTKVDYCIQKNLPFVPILSQTYPVHTTLYSLSKIHLNIVHPLTPWHLYWSLSF
jgi:hypothetical protein